MAALIFAVLDEDAYAVTALLQHPDVDVNATVAWRQIVGSDSFRPDPFFLWLTKHHIICLSALTWALRSSTSTVIRLLLAAPGLDVNDAKMSPTPFMTALLCRCPHTVYLLSSVPTIRVDEAAIDYARATKQKESLWIMMEAARWAARRVWVSALIK